MSAAVSRVSCISEIFNQPATIRSETFSAVSFFSLSTRGVTPLCHTHTTAVVAAVVVVVVVGSLQSLAWEN